ncbi:LA_2272 family surface repeat-containing protein [Gemmatimonadota bacterium]
MLRKSNVLLGLAALTIILIYTPVQAQNRPIQIAIVTPLQLFPEENSISGIRFNLIYGRNVSVTGLDVGLINHTTTGKSKGIQFGMVSVVESDFMGWQDNCVSVTKGKFEGFQSGIINYSNNMNGFQLGLVNYAETMKGLQVGLVNIIKQGGTFPVFPIVNWSF